MSDLLTAVDALTLPSVVKVKQSDGDREWVTPCRQDPLLIQLRDAVAGGIGSHAGASAARERMPIDAGALELWGHIEGVVSSWYWAIPDARMSRREVKMRSGVDVSTRLRVWYVHHANQVRAGKVSQFTDLEVTRKVEGWVSKIRGTFDPPIRLELTELVDGQSVPVKCPECGERFAFDPMSGDRVTAVVVEYRELGEETLDRAVGSCRSCSALWRGRSSLRALRWLLDSGEKVSD